MSTFAARLAVLQLPLVYLVAMVLGLTLYGSEFGSDSGRVYLLSLPAIVVIGLAPARHAAWLARAARPAALAGIALAGFAYRPLHFAWWDERSLDQAVRLAALGVATAIVAAGARAQLERARVPARGGLAPALLVIALVWLAAGWQPMLPFLGLGVGFALCLAVGAPEVRSQPVSAPDAAPAVAFGWLRYLAVLVGLDLSLAAWDWQQIPSWGPVIAAGFLGSAIPACWPERLAKARRRGSVAVFAGMGATCFIAAALFPPFALLPVHALYAGACMGLLLVWSGARDSELPYWMLVGFLLGHLATQQLAFASLRVLLLLPFLIAFLLSARRARAAHSTT